MRTYLFYDIETTGLNKAFDQIIQFAAIRTDSELNEMERLELLIKINPDVTPSPHAAIIHRIHLKNLSTEMNELSAIQKIHQWVNQPGTISLGYNTLNFDDEFLRFSFYRNLLPPYQHQFKNQCKRMDIYPMALFFFLFKKNVIEWPTLNEKTSFKLENLNIANQLIAGASHHAMVDTEVTLAIARAFFKERKMWDYIAGYFDKDIEIARLQPLYNTLFIMIDGRLSIDYYQSIVLCLGYHKHYKNQLLWLRIDTQTLTDLTLETVETTPIIRKKLGEPNFLLPFKERFLTHMSADRIKLANANKQWLEKNSAILQALITHHTEKKYPFYPETDIDARLYLNGFWNKSEEQFCHAFHAASHPKEKAKLTEKLNEGPLKTLAIRILGRHYPEVLGRPEQEIFANYLEKAKKGGLIDFQGKSRLTPNAGLEEIAHIQQNETLDAEQIILLKEWRSLFCDQ